MAQPARHREAAGKIQIPAVQRWGAEQRLPVVGTRLIREWDGVEHTVIVLKDGFDWQGRKFKSLSAVARAITGTRWNGYRFFGLRERRRELA